MVGLELFCYLRIILDEPFLVVEIIAYVCRCSIQQLTVTVEKLRGKVGIEKVAHVGTNPNLVLAVVFVD